MPIYEEKLISPLAIRFTQQRIRTTFRDGQDVEETIEQIVPGSNDGDYDVVLAAPFPCIEIIRWSPTGRGADRDDHWFTFDNRRLYCLQRLAAEHWPKRVAAVVHVLYADAGTVRKKLDSRTHGLSVTIGHAFATAEELKVWTWRDAVKGRTPPGLDVTLAAQAAISADDAKASVTDLVEPADHVSPQGVLAHTTEASPYEESTLTSLIGQLLDLKTKQSPQTCEYMSEGSSSTEFDQMLPPAMTDLSSCGSADEDEARPCSSPKTPPGILLRVQQDVDECVDSMGQAAPSNEEGSLTGLIGQLLKLEATEHSHSGMSPKSPSDVEALEPASLCGDSPVSKRLQDLIPENTVDPFSGQVCSSQAYAALVAEMAQRQRVQWQAAQVARLQVAQMQAMRTRQAQAMMFWQAAAWQRARAGYP